MSYSKPCAYNKKALNLQIVNTYVAVHDLNCGCNEPLQHIIRQIEDQEPTVKTCRTTTAAGDAPTTTDGIDDFGGDELERLFAEDDEKDITG